MTESRIGNQTIVRISFHQPGFDHQPKLGKQLVLLEQKGLPDGPLRTTKREHGQKVDQVDTWSCHILSES